MAGTSIDANATLQCPHGGTVRISPSSQKSTVGGAAMTAQSDSTTVSGCPFQKPAGPSTVPSPCLTVKWIVGDTRVKVSSVPSLSKSAVGICFSGENIPQGSVVIASTQSKGTSQ